ncbi:hypothetical protein BLA60_40345 [Actinophytocola xinjiangensis]|uniref:Uncharacterized protein n=1 Tax=Actinophytocola xinjiangensis TaxID=485602 RepID=A0A7Z0WCY3_9PSEU|nr:hypothetical protein [Actinophytocola xinjiangensis]OLF04544.1 hypothetical protein BLA60_40345 [Actinophytocola xinjiangensis]
MNTTMDIVPFMLTSTEDTTNRVYAACMLITTDAGDSDVVVFRRGTDGAPMLGISDSPERALRLHSMVTPLRIEWCHDTN